MVFDICCGHFFGIHGYDFFFYILCNGVLIFFNDLWFKFSISISWNINLHISIARMHHLLRMSVSAVIGAFVAIVIFTVTKFLLQFLIQSPFKDDRHHISHDGIDIRSIFDFHIIFFQITLHKFLHHCFLWCILFPCHFKNLHTE